MRNTLIWGTLFIGVLFGAVLLKQISFYLQIHSIVIVFGGTLGILLLSAPLESIRVILRHCLGFFRTDLTFEEFKGELPALSEKKSLSNSSRHPLIQYASDLWSQGINPDLFVVLLSQKRDELSGQSAEALQALRNLAKYPPALGMTGTVMGMVALFVQLDTQREQIGASLAMAMTATFFGLILTNVLLSPLADRVHLRHLSEQKMNQSIYQVLLLINQGEPGVLVKDEVNSRAG